MGIVGLAIGNWIGKAGKKGELWALQGLIGLGRQGKRGHCGFGKGELDCEGWEKG